MKTLKKASVLMLCFALTVMLFGFSVSAEELISGDYTYVILEDGTAKITAYNGADVDVTVPDKIEELDVTVIGAGAFDQKGDIESLVIPGSVKELETGAVNFCTKLESITINEGALSEIPGSAIKNCAALTTVNLPSNVTSIGTFAGCTALENIAIASDNESLKNVDGVICSADMKTLIKFPQGKKATEYYIPTSVTKIANNAFYEVQSPVKVYIPLSVKEIEGLPFAYSRVTLHYEGTSLPAGWQEAVDGFSLTLNAYKLGKTEKITSAPAENAIKLNWTPVYGATCYNVYVRKGSSWKKLAEVKGTTYTATGATYGSSYTFAVKAGKTSGGKTTWSSVYTTYTAVAKIPAPAKVTSTQSTSAIKLSWSAVKGVDGYRVFYKTASGWKPLSIVLTTSVTYNNLKAGASYTFAVKAGKKISGKVVWSDVYTTHMTATNPAKPSKVTASQGTDWIKLDWSACNGATGYTIYYQKNGGWAVGQSAIPGTTHTFNNLKSGAKYTFAVRPYIKIDNRVIWGAYTTYTASVKPANPEVTVTSPSIGKINVKWNAVPGATEYRLYYKKNTGGYLYYKTYSSAGTVSFDNLTGGDTFTFVVRAGIKTTAGVVLSGYTEKSVTLQYRTPRYLNAFKNGVFRIKYTQDGETTTFSFERDNALLEFKDEEGSDVAFLYHRWGFLFDPDLNYKWMYINHTYKIQAPLKPETAKDFFTAEELMAELQAITVPEKYNTTKANFGGKSCQVEYYTKDGITYYYYYNGATLVGIMMKNVKTGEKLTFTVHSMTTNLAYDTFTEPSYADYAPI